MKPTLDAIAHDRYSVRPVVAVAAAEDSCVLAALREAVRRGLCRALLIGDAREIRAIALREGIDLSGMDIVDCADRAESCRLAVQLVRQKRAQAVMKGLVSTATMLREVVNAETGLRESELLSYVGVFELPGFDRLIYLTDPAVNMYPDLAAKQHIIQNAVTVANALGNSLPVVGCLCAIETVNPKMPCTLDAAELVRINRAGGLSNCVVTGPLALDNCLFREAALHKGIEDPNAGQTDILLAPQIETGNALYKSFAFVARASCAGVVVGAAAPVILTSRADSADTKLNSIALAMRIAYERMNCHATPDPCDQPGIYDDKNRGFRAGNAAV
ncbi:MAG: bifunctional enoyl-CoA hydratase/phosphate acetyltransferase [Clostridiales bacterium]|nr:bifunctional enoyl-CoA hydratase/phosphate acetyltransferase [Clostridiales bacterium]